ncbi:Uncharacterised protein [uncultured archaeon]|nr:Uncharacterised protein [uncultured archaeon]
MAPEISERIKLFKMVRDIPYYIAVNEGEQGYECVTKPEMLSKLLRATGLKTRDIVCYFKWEDLSLPKKLLKISHDNPETHGYIEVFIPETNKWVKVDPNWDSRIDHPKIPIAEWDGLTDTKLAVIPIKTLSPEESTAFNSQDVGDEREKYMERNLQFFKALNKWLRSIRKPI